MEEDSMSDRQLREDCRSDFFDVVVYDYGKTGHLCQDDECEALLTMVECTSSCPHYNTCEDSALHHANGRAWCPVEKEMKE